jgi:hypothetical protein
MPRFHWPGRDGQIREERSAAPRDCLITTRDRANLLSPRWIRSGAPTKAPLWRFLLRVVLASTSPTFAGEISTRPAMRPQRCSARPCRAYRYCVGPRRDFGVARRNPRSGDARRRPMIVSS